MSPFRIIEYILLILLALGSGWQIYVYNRLFWGAVGIVIPLIVIILLFVEDRKQ
jgi:uncharacterized membrane protein